MASDATYGLATPGEAEGSLPHFLTNLSCISLLQGIVLGLVLMTTVDLLPFTTTEFAPVNIVLYDPVLMFDFAPVVTTDLDPVVIVDVAPVTALELPLAQTVLEAPVVTTAASEAYTLQVAPVVTWDSDPE